MTKPRLPHTLTGAADRCCPLLCDYRPEAVQVYLSYVLEMERAGEDPCEVAACKPINRDGSGGTAGDGNLRVVDVYRAVQALRAERKTVDAVRVAMKLCPWALIDQEGE